MASAVFSAVAENNSLLLFCCEETNDLYQAALSLPNSNLKRVPLSSCIYAAASLKNGSSVLMLADEAPGRTIVMPDGIFSLLHTRYIRVFAEYAVVPSGSAGWASFRLSDPWPCPDFSRLVATPDSPLWSKGRSKTQPLDVLEPNACQYVPYYSSGAPLVVHLDLAKVAGFTRAAFGLNGSAPVAALVTPPHYPGLMLSSLPLSLVRRHRYSPASSWQRLWQDLLRWLQFSESTTHHLWTDSLTWQPIVRPNFGANSSLSSDRAVETQRAVMASMKWAHTVSGLLVKPAQLKIANAVGLWGPRSSRYVLGSWPSSLVPIGGDTADGDTADGSDGIFEAYLSAVQPRGGGIGGNISSQFHSLVIRTDCVGEAAAGLAIGGWSGGDYVDERASTVAENLMDYLFFNSSAFGWPRSDPKSPVGGTLLWGTNMQRPHGSEIYADDQGRIAYSTLFAAAVLNSSRWDRPIMTLILGNFRLMNSAGYFQCSISAGLLMSNGWRKYFDDSSHNENNYYQSAMRAVALMAYGLTGAPVLLNRTRAGLATTMEAFYKRQWVCQVHAHAKYSATPPPPLSLSQRPTPLRFPS
jgi:hypothetical protein